MHEKRVVCKVLIGKDEERRLLSNHTYKQEDDIRMDQKIRMGGCGLDSSDLGQGPVAGICEHSNELCIVTDCWES